MPCIFCQSQFHRKNECSNPNTRIKEEEINSFIRTTYSSSQRHNLTQDEFETCISIILRNKCTVIELRMSIEDFKRKTHSTESVNGNKQQLIVKITDMACRFYLYTFTPPSPQHIVNQYQLTGQITDGIRAVTNEILHPRFGNVQPRVATSQPQRAGDLHPPADIRSHLAQPRVATSQPQRAGDLHPPAEVRSHQAQPRVANTPPQQAERNLQTLRIQVGNLSVMVPLPNNIESRQRIISNINHHNTFYNRLYNTVPSPQIPPSPQYTVHKTDKECAELAECAVCFNTLNNETYVYLGCSHEFCKKCIKECLTRVNLCKCPLCRAPITDVYTQLPNVSYSI